METEYHDYDPGLLNDYGGGNVDWWRDYIRAEVGAANEYWQEIVAQLENELSSLEAVCDKHKAEIGRLRKEIYRARLI